MGISKNLTRASVLLLTTGLLSACDGFQMPSLGLRTPEVAVAPPSINRPQPDSRGVITYENYQVMVARSGDTIATMATRAGLSPEELGRHNGLETAYAPRIGEVIALPENVGGTVVSTPLGWSPEIATTAIENASARGGGIGGSTPSVGTPNAPLRHRVEAGETAYSVARLYNVSVTALSSWNGLGPDLGVRVGQELIIPVPDTARIVAETPTPVTPVVAPVTAPVTTPTAPPVNNAVTGGFVRPVNGSIIRGFNASSGRNKSDGIDYSVPAGTSVRVASAGTVALVSDSNGALGTIVLVRHAGGLLTVYGRVTDVTVAKGDAVTGGQIIGVVAAGDSPSLHFEVRKGTEPVDPAQYLN